MVNDDITYKFTVDSERIVVPFKKDGKLFSQSRTYAHIYSMTSLGQFNLAEQLTGAIREACKEGWKHAFPDTVYSLPNPSTPVLVE